MPEDAAVGISPDRLERAFDEVYQIDNPKPGANIGAAVGRSIVKRLPKLLAHPIDVRSQRLAK